MRLRCGPHTLDLSQPIVMGILNVTPDSFSDGGRFIDSSQALDHARRMLEAGSLVLDACLDSGWAAQSGATWSARLKLSFPWMVSLPLISTWWNAAVSLFKSLAKFSPRRGPPHSQIPMGTG